MALILDDVEVGGRRTKVRIAGGRVDAIADDVSAAVSDRVIAGHGGALLTGLRDDHVHVLATVAARQSVAVGPADTADRDAFVGALRAAARGQGSVRAIGYHESVAGDLDVHVLDAIDATVPIRVQHRTGALWVLNTPALNALGAARRADPRVERDPHGEPTGLVWRGDDLLRADGDDDLPPVDALGRELASYGITSITDATATNDARTAGRLAELPQRVRVMGPLELTSTDRRVALGEVKVLLDDDDLPGIDDVVALVRGAHLRARGVAFHCVTLVQVRFAIEALRLAGTRRGRDRIEHASVAPADVVSDLADLGVAVATQPAFVAARGDDYLRDVDPRDVGALYPVASLLRAGIDTRLSSDAPYGPIDPWVAMRAAVDRTTPSGHVLGADECIGAAEALAAFGARTTLHRGERADLVLLATPLAVARRDLRHTGVVVTIIDGEVVHDARPSS